MQTACLTLSDAAWRGGEGGGEGRGGEGRGREGRGEDGRGGEERVAIISSALTHNESCDTHVAHHLDNA